ncbi:MAG: hypothetical protein GY714_18420 [Desulfobacterales bacterium]|nr:hypothetical protein [Desulfobacterales bacterium]
MNHNTRARERTRAAAAGGNKATIQSTINAGKTPTMQNPQQPMGVVRPVQTVIGANGQPLYVQQGQGQPVIYAQQPQVPPSLFPPLCFCCLCLKQKGRGNKHTQIGSHARNAWLCSSKPKYYHFPAEFHSKPEPAAIHGARRRSSSNPTTSACPNAA